jgi:hypothetical protein
MRTEATLLLFLTFAVFTLVLPKFCGCAGERPGTFDVKRDHEAISRILDAALLSDKPTQEFQRALVTVRSFASVDSAWTEGVSFYVKYRNGGIVSWTAPPKPTIPSQH